MPLRPFRFLHASDLHLEQVPTGLAQVPEHLRQQLLETSYQAAEFVFDTALTEDVQFVILAGDVIDIDRAGPRGIAFLRDKFERLAEHDITVYWAGGANDGPDGWPCLGFSSSCRPRRSLEPSTTACLPARLRPARLPGS